MTKAEMKFLYNLEGILKYHPDRKKSIKNLTLNENIKFLLLASKEGLPEVVKFISEQIFLENPDFDFEEVFYLAIDGNHVEIAKFIIDNFELKYPFFDMKYALKKKSYVVAENIINKYYFNEDDIIYFLIVSKLKDRELTKTLLSKIETINFKDFNSKYYNKENLRLILEKAELTDEDKIKYQEEIFRLGSLKLVNDLLKNALFDPSFNDNYALKVAIIFGYDKIVKLLLDKGIVVRNLDVQSAAAFGHLNILKMLLRDPSVELSNAVILKAAENGHLDIVKFLLKDPSVNPEGVIKTAVSLGDYEMVKFLLKERRIIIPHDLLSTAAENGHFEIVKLLLLDERINPNDIEAVVTSYENNHPEIVKLIVSDPNFYEDYGPILDLVVEYGDIETLKVILKSPYVDLSVNNYSVLELALEKEYFEIYDLLKKDIEKYPDPSVRSHNILIDLTKKEIKEEMEEVLFLNQNTEELTTKKALKVVFDNLGNFMADLNYNKL